MKRIAFCFVIFTLAITLLTFQAHPKTNEENVKQLNDDEPYNLIELMKLPPKTSFVWSNSKLEQKSSYQLFIGSRLDFNFESEVKTWIQKWNEKDGKNFGEAKIIEDIKQADLILARYQNIRETSQKTDYKDTDVAPGDAVGKMKESYWVRPLYSYLMIPKGKDFHIIWRQRKLIRLDEKPKKSSADDVLSALAKQLKSRQ